MNTLQNWSFSLLEKSTEKLAEWSFGQSILNHMDRLLLVIEQSTEWSVPVMKHTADDNSLDDVDKTPKLIRPLPWLIFLPLLLILRLIRFGINTLLEMCGYEPYSPSTFVEILQNCRRKLGVLRYQADLSITRSVIEKKKMADNYVPLMTRLEIALKSTLCYSSQNFAPNSESNMEKITVVRRHFSDVLNSSQTVLRRYTSNSKRNDTHLPSNQEIGTQTTPKKSSFEMPVDKYIYEVDENANGSSLDSFTSGSDSLSDFKDINDDREIKVGKMTSDFNNFNENSPEVGRVDPEDCYFSLPQSVCSTPEPKITPNSKKNSTISSKLPKVSNKITRLNNIAINNAQKNNIQYQRDYFDNIGKSNSEQETDKPKVPKSSSPVSSLLTGKFVKKSNKKSSSTSNLNLHIPVLFNNSQSSPKKKHVGNK